MTGGPQGPHRRVGDGRLAAAVFDMDGLLVDSEPLWHDAEVAVLAPLGVPMAAGEPRRTKGMAVREVTRYWFERYPWEGPSPDAVAEQVVDAVIELVLARGVARPGVDAALEVCRRHRVALAVASSSDYRLIHPVLAHFGWAGTFEVVCSAADEALGKPHPAVFVTTAQRLGVVPDRCVVFEDSGAGVLAAKAARMTCVAVPEPAERDQPAFAIADAVLASLAEVDEALWETLERAAAGG